MGVDWRETNASSGDRPVLIRVSQRGYSAVKGIL